MHLDKRFLIRTVLLAALTLGLLVAAPAAAATVYLEGFVTAAPEPGCMLVKDHDGNVYALQGTGWYGVLGNDYVRLEGSIVPEPACGASSSIRVSDVTTVWRDDTRKVIVYERTKEGRFADWVRRHREREWRDWEREHHIPPPPPQ